MVAEDLRKLNLGLDVAVAAVPATTIAKMDFKICGSL